MKASELRIGNLVLKHNGEITKVSGQFIADFEKYGNETLMTIPPRPFYTGIPLTSEWLERLGFKRYGNLNQAYFLNEEIDTSFSFGNYARSPQDYEYKPSLRVAGQIIYSDLLRYVHQLQNLYFALTNTELIIKE